MCSTVIFSSLLSFSITFITSFLPDGSSIAVASSNIIHFGLIAIIPAIATLCFWPPDNKCGCLSFNSVIPTLAKASLTLSLINLGSIPKFSGPNATSSSTTVATIWLSGFWNTIPAVCLISHNFSSSFVSFPFIRILPLVGIKIAFKFLDNVDLPEPLCPIIATNSPCLTSKLKLSIALKVDSSVMYSYEILLTFIILFICSTPSLK